jgi:hypothetical protein
MDPVCSAVLLTFGSHWQAGMNYRNPLQKIQAVDQAFSRYAVVQQVAAFDLFSRDIVCDFARFSQWARTHIAALAHEHAAALLTPQERWGVSPCCNEMANKLGDLKDRLSDLKDLLAWTPSPKAKSVFPILDLLRMIRNRIVHADSLIGSDLAEFSNSSELKAALKAFQIHFARREFPALPPFHRGRPLELRPVHAIFAGVVLYEFAKELNEHVCSHMTEDEFIDMAFFYGVLTEFHAYRTVRHRTAEARISFFLRGRHMVGSSVEQAPIIHRLRSQTVNQRKKQTSDLTNLWQVACDRHAELCELERQPAGGTNAP